MTVLIITRSNDNDCVDRVSAAVEDLGSDVLRFDSDLFPTETGLRLATDGAGDRLELRLPGESGWRNLGDLEAVWYRRFSPGGGLPAGMDAQVKNASAGEIRRVLVGLFSVLDTFWLDPVNTVKNAVNKQLQLEMARELGLEIPDSLTTNDPEAVRRFFDAHPEGIITKMLSSFAIYDDEGRENVVFTNPVTAEDLEDLSGLELCPMTFQETVPKDVELRVTVVGRRVFTAAIDSQSRERATHDWRREGAAMVEEWQPHELPKDVEHRLLGLCDWLGLNYGAIDLILTPDGRHVFLEINPSGEFFWLEHQPGFPLSRCLAEVLVDPGRRR